MARHGYGSHLSFGCDDRLTTLSCTEEMCIHGLPHPHPRIRQHDYRIDLTVLSSRIRHLSHRIVTFPALLNRCNKLRAALAAVHQHHMSQKAR
ncbi:hypothetical protein GE21DRAFT_1313644 [Neurospora crassa]|nr:hypothetical protein GE21DRAFT_1313644 [Neurospora crassa]